MGHTIRLAIIAQISIFTLATRKGYKNVEPKFPKGFKLLKLLRISPYQRVKIKGFKLSIGFKLSGHLWGSSHYRTEIIGVQTSLRVRICQGVQRGSNFEQNPHKYI